MTDDERYRDLSARNIFKLSREEHEWLMERRRKIDDEKWEGSQVSGYGFPTGYEPRLIDALARLWRWVRGR